jgi:predicted transcriptional regulator
MIKKPSKERTSITIDPLLHAKLKELAAQEKTSVSALIEDACRSIYPVPTADAVPEVDYIQGEATT